MPVKKITKHDVLTEDQTAIIWHRVFIDSSVSKLHKIVGRLKGAACGYIDKGVLFHKGSRLNADTLSWVAHDFGGIVASQRLGALLGQYPVVSTINARSFNSSQDLYVLIVFTRETEKDSAPMPFFFILYGNEKDIDIVATELKANIIKFLGLRSRKQ